MFFFFIRTYENMKYVFYAYFLLCSAILLYSNIQHEIHSTRAYSNSIHHFTTVLEVQNFSQKEDMHTNSNKGHKYKQY